MRMKNLLIPRDLVAAVTLVLVFQVSGQRWATQVCPKVGKYVKQERCSAVGASNECPFRCFGNTKCCPTSDTCGVRCTPTVPKTGCPIPVDIALLLDSSGSIGKDNWKKVLEAAKNLVDAYDVSERGTHFGLISYSTNVSLDISFTQFTGVNRNAVNLKRFIDTLPLQGGKTYIDKALKLANDELFDERKGMREKYKKICIVLTDGKQTTEGEFTPPAEVSALLKDKGVEVYTLAIGEDVDVFEALEISTGDGYLYTVTNFDGLNEKMKAILDRQCKGCEKSLDLVLGVPNSMSLGQEIDSIKDVMSKFVGLFKVNNKNAHIGIVSYNGEASLELPLNRLYSTPELQRFIRAMPSSQAHGFNTAAALTVAADHAFSIYGGVRQTQPKVMVLFAPRASSSTTEAIRAAATKLKGIGVRLMVVGIQNTADSATYSSLVTQPPKTFLQNKVNYEDLSVALYEMADTVCKSEYGKCPPPGPPSAEVNPEDLYQCTHDQDCKQEGGLCCVSGDGGTECRVSIKNCFMPFEMAIAIDNSNTLQTPDLSNVKTFIKNLMRPYANSENAIHFGLMTYAGTTRKITDGFRKFRSESDLQNMIDGLEITTDPERKVDVALRSASRDFFSMEGGTRHGHPRYLVFLTTSGASPGSENLKSASKDLDLLNVQRIAVGIKSDADLAFLQELASDNNLAFSVQSSDQLPAVLNRIQPLLCKEKKGTCPPPSIPDPALCRRPLDPQLIPCGRSANKPMQSQQQNDWDCPGEAKCCVDATGCHSVCTYPKIICGKNKDTAILMENTDLIGGERAFGLVKSFAAELAGAFSISKDSTHVSIATYRSRPRTVLTFSDAAAKDRNQLLEKIINIQFGGGKVGSTTAALQTAVNLFKTDYGARDNINQTLVLIGSFDVRQTEKAASIANMLRSNLIDIFAVSIGDRANYPALRSIVSKDVAKNVFTATSADAMKAQLRQLVKTICDGALKEYIACAQVWGSTERCHWQFISNGRLVYTANAETMNCFRGIAFHRQDSERILAIRALVWASTWGYIVRRKTTN